MINKEILGYSVFFKQEEEAEKFFRSIPEQIKSELIREEKEVILIGVEPVKKEDFSYVFRKGNEKVSVEPLKILFVETLFARE